MAHDCQWGDTLIFSGSPASLGEGAGWTGLDPQWETGPPQTHSHSPSAASVSQDHSPFPLALESRVALITKAYSKGLIAEFYNQHLGNIYGEKFLLFAYYLAHVARLEFPRETGLILRCAGKAGNPSQTTQGNRLSCRDQEGTRVLSPNGRGGWTPLRPLRGLQETRVVSPFSPPDRDRRGDSLAWSGRGSRPSRRTSG